MDKCPSCNTAGCYNSGFTVDCVSMECRHYSEKQARLFHQERDTEPPEAEDKEEVEWGAGEAPARTMPNGEIYWKTEPTYLGKFPTPSPIHVIGGEVPDLVYYRNTGDVDLGAQGECVLCDAGIPIKVPTSSSAVTAGLPDWLQGVFDNCAKALRKDPVLLTQEDLRRYLNKNLTSEFFTCREYHEKPVDSS